MLTAMLVNYLTIFVLLVFNEFYGIGTILYTCINIVFMVYLTVTAVGIIEKLQHMLIMARNHEYPAQAVKIKLSIMKMSIC